MPYKESSMWKQMLKARPISEENIRWLLGIGKVDAFKDCWLQRTYNFPVLVKVKELFINNKPNEANKSYNGV